MGPRQGSSRQPDRIQISKARVDFFTSHFENADMTLRSEKVNTFGSSIYKQEEESKC